MWPPHIIDRFHSKTKKAANGCIVWAAGKYKHGYGGFWALGAMRKAHRVAWEIANGPILDPKMHVLHRCDNRPCVNPDHLFLGTIADNMLDRDKKGRGLSGERANTAKLKAEEVREIRQSNVSSTVLAAEYGVSWSTICQIRRGDTWKGI